MSLPTCGLASQSMRRGAPASTKVCRISRWAGLLVPVASLPSEKVPEPPRPNCMLLSGSRMPVALNRSMASVLLREPSPRSTRSGATPASASASAQKSPAHPAPTTTGRSSPSDVVTLGKRVGCSSTTFSCLSTCHLFALPSSALSAFDPPRRTMRAVQLRWTSFFLRASTERLRSSREESSLGGKCSMRSTALRTARSSASSEPSRRLSWTRMLETSIMRGPILLRPCRRPNRFSKPKRG